MTPDKTDKWGVCIALLVTEPVMDSVDGYPACRAVLQVEHTHCRERVFKPLGTGKSAVCQHPVVTDGDTEHSKNEVPQDRDPQA